jgi:predicted NUDIX family NTP pyrophosphohydrolase
MAKKISGGLVLYEQINGSLKFLIAHPGGPFFKNRDQGYWSIPKGEPEEEEEIFDAAVREFEEETGLIPEGPYINLGTILQKNGKLVYAWGFAGSWVEGTVPKCNEITLEYPKGSGKIWTFPEIDQAIMMPAEESKQKLSADQAPLIDRLIQSLNEKERVTKS